MKRARDAKRLDNILHIHIPSDKQEHKLEGILKGEPWVTLGVAAAGKEASMAHVDAVEDGECEEENIQQTAKKAEDYIVFKRQGITNNQPNKEHPHIPAQKGEHCEGEELVGGHFVDGDEGPVVAAPT